MDARTVSGLRASTAEAPDAPALSDQDETGLDSLRIDANNDLTYRSSDGRTYRLPPFIPMRRQREWEPRGRWLQDRPVLGWPDTMVGPEVGPWSLRILLFASMTLGQITIDGGAGRRWLLVGLALAALAWCEWWRRWDLTSVGRRLLVAGVIWIAAVALILVSPLAGIFAWGFFTISGTFFTGWLMLVVLMLGVIPMNATQLGGFDMILVEWPLALGLFAFCVSVGVITSAVVNKREEAALRRIAVHRELVAEQRRSSALQRDLLARARWDGVTAERGRLARELHDTVAQGLVAIVTQLEAINDEADFRTRVEAAKELARQSLGEARRAVNALQPPALDAGGLPDAIDTVVHDWAALDDVEAQVRLTGEVRETDADPVLVRICQEALSNVSRHAGASKVAVTLTYLEDEVLLDIRDDGTGFTVAGASAAGKHGLRGMAERVRLIGGRLAVESEPGAGTVVSAAVPA